MENKIHYSPQALTDLDEIWNYIALELSNPIAAENTVNGIIAAVDTLKVFSGAGAMLRFFDGMNSGYRFVCHKNYLAFYRVIDMDVFVDRVIYGKRDYMKLLFDEQFDNQ